MVKRLGTLVPTVASFISNIPCLLILIYKFIGVAYDIRSSLYFWIIEGGQGPLYRYNTSEDTFSNLVPSLDTPISLASDWVGRRLFWVQDGISVSCDYIPIAIRLVVVLQH
jgi:hypothetical protein